MEEKPASSPRLPAEGVARTAGVAGRGIELLDTRLRIVGPDDRLPPGDKPGTISLWFAREAGVSNKVLFCYGRMEVGQARGLWLVGEDRLCFYFFAHPRDLYAMVPGGIAPGRWHHVAATYDGTTARLYYDGRRIGQVEVKLDTARTGQCRLGFNLEENDGRDFVGHLDELAVYDRALSDGEIRDYHAALSANLPPVAATPAAPVDVPALLGVDEIIFAVRKIDSESHWYANFGPNCIDDQRRYYHDGGKLCRLDLRTGRRTVLLDDPAGGVRDPQLHYDGRKILFAYRKGGQPYYHLHEIDADGANLRRLTDGPYDDIEPTYLPDGDIVFVSSRCNRWVPCYVTQVAVLYRCGGDGSDIRPLSANTEHENTPWPLSDGRILYQRWEYVDRSQVGFHHLWTMNPDGTGQMVFYGNQRPDTVMIDAKPIPGTSKIVASFSPGHGQNEHSGQITIVDPSSGPDNPAFARPIGRGHYRDPYPLSDQVFLVADATGPGEAGTRILALRANGRAVPIYQLPADEAKAGLKVHEPRPVQRRKREPVIAAKGNSTGQTGTVLVENVYNGRNMEGFSPGVEGFSPGELKQLLVLEILPKPLNIFSGMEPLSYGGTFLLERIVGTVPLEPDGSAYVELPAMRPMFFAILDDKGLCVKRMQSFVTVQPGESVSCVGCHEERYKTPRSRRVVLASRRPPSVIQPIAGLPDVIDFPRDIQPVLDRHCLPCHGHAATKAGGPMSGGILLAGDHGPMYSLSYYALTISAQFADGRNLRRSNYEPRTIGSSASGLMRKLDGGHHGVKVSRREKLLVQLWIDSAAVYAGTYAALGTGSIGNYRHFAISREDLAWPATQAGKAAIERRCGPCHSGKLALPLTPSDDKGLVPWGEGPMNDLASRTSQRYNPVFRFNRHLVYDLSQPEKSLILRAPLAVQAGGFAICTSGKIGGSSQGPGITKTTEATEITKKEEREHKEAARGPLPLKGPPIFAATDDPDYRAILGMVVRSAEHLAQIKRFDMEGFRPDPAWVREMKRFGFVPADLPAEARIDVYAAEAAYWRSFWR